MRSSTMDTTGRNVSVLPRGHTADPPEERRAQDALVLEHLGLAETLARRFAGRIGDRDDIRQVAYVGLVKAARRFDSTRTSDFVSFAVPTITGEIKRHLRDDIWFVRPPRRVQELRLAIAHVSPELAQELGHAPTWAQLAERLREDPRDVREALGSDQSMHPASLSSVVAEDDSVALADLVGGCDAELERAEMLATVAPACKRLAPRERRILYLRFYEDRTQQEIARELGVTQMQVSRLLARILARLREAVQGPAPVASISDPAAAPMRASVRQPRSA